MSQGGVTLGLLLVLQEAFPEIGEGVVALGMAIIIGNILGGPILLKTALVASETESGEGPGSDAGAGVSPGFGGAGEPDMESTKA